MNLLYRSVVKVPIGWLGLVADQNSLVRVISRPDQDQVLERLQRDCPRFADGESNVLRQAVLELEAYFAGTGRSFTVPLCFEDVRGFTRACLEALQKTPYGEVLSYGELAAAAGSPRAARAVGNAMAANPWPIIVPCHRVLASCGKLGGYSGGAGPVTKSWLLEFERMNSAEPTDLA